MGARVRMESRVVGSAGFWPGTPAGARGSPGPRGEPGNTALLPSALRTFRIHSQEVALEADPCQPRHPPSPSGQPGSDGESEGGLSRLPAWHPGGGPGLPGSPWRARQYGSFAVHTWIFLHSYPGRHVRGWPMPVPPPVGHPASGGEPGCGLRRLRAWHPGGGTRLPGTAWRAGHKGLPAVHTWKILHPCPGKSRQGLANADPLLPGGRPGGRVESAQHPGRLTGLPGAAWRARQNATLSVIQQCTL